jgi:molybdenum cofactor cytidylyltransferase
MINAVVLAAGASKRMGKPKPLLRFRDSPSRSASAERGRTFLEQIVAVLRLSDADRITVVLGAEAEAIRKTVDLSGVNIVINKDYQKGQLSSLIAAIKTTPPQTQAILVCLADMPFITAEVVNEIIGKFKETDAPIIVPVFDNKRGHPPLFARAVFDELLSAPAEQGARFVLCSNEQRILELQTSESGILIRIDTPDDYRLHFGAEPTL